MADRFLDHIYAGAKPEEADALYDAWAETYEAELAENGYATPGRIARALALHAPARGTPVLDFGCGTGLSGLALKAEGFTVIDGMDPSSEMLRRAGEKEIYRHLKHIDITDPAPIPQGSYALIVAAGVIGPGAAPASTIEILIRALPASGLLALSLNDQAVSEAVYEGAMHPLLDGGAARLRFKEHGAHLPGRNLNSTIYLIEKA